MDLELNIKEADKAEFIGQILDLFEDFLTEKGVEIPNPEREEDAEEDAAILYGSDYGDLAEGIREILQNWAFSPALTLSEDGKMLLRCDENATGKVIIPAGVTEILHIPEN